MGKYKIITLCGSTKFRDDFIRIQKELTLQGNIVLSVGFLNQYENINRLPKETMDMLADIHRKKIDMSDEIFVINKNNYIGQSTQSEIIYARAKGIPVRYME